MFRILDRYLVREIVGPFLLALLVFTFVLEIPPIIQQAESLISKGVAWSVVGRALLTLLPQALSLTIPIAVLLGVLVGFARLSADREFVAMQACGVSLVRLARPVILVALVGTAATAYEVMIALPDANQTFREIAYGVVREQVETKIKPRIFFEEIPNRVIYVQDLPPGGGWRDVFLADTTRSGYTTVYFAREGRIIVDRDKRLVHVQLIDGSSHTTSSTTPELYENARFESIILSVDPSTIFPSPPSRGVPEMTFAELRATIAEAAPRAAKDEDARKLMNAARWMWSYKFALPATCPILALIGLALGATNRKDGKFSSFVVGLAVVLVYYVFVYGARSIASGGRLNPSWAPWIPNILMTIAGVLMLAWRGRLADQPLRLRLPAWRRRTANGDRLPARPSGPVVVVRVPHLDLPRPRTLDVYLGREYLRIFLLAVASLMAIFYISTFIDLVDKLLRGDTTTAMLFQFFYYKTPQFVYYVVPMGALVATLVTIGVLTKNNELMVMRACGISLYRTAAPLIVFALAASGVIFFVQERVLAHTSREADRLERVIRKWPALVSPLDRRWAIGAAGSMYHYDFFDRKANRFSQLHVYELDEASWTLGAVTYARDAAPASAVEPEEGASIPWTARQGWERVLSSNGGPDSRAIAVKYTPFTERQLLLEPPKYFKSDSPDIDMMTFRQLRDFIGRLEASGADAGEYKVGLQRKIAFPLVTVILTMLAVPFAVTTGRRGALYGIGAAIVIAIVYWIGMSIFAAFGAGGLLPPLLAAWAPNLLCGAAAAYLILTVRT
jgi:LPS export ABC transporter permease LptF/LPS export ABC transporter permease LptG